MNRIAVPSLLDSLFLAGCSAHAALQGTLSDAKRALARIRPEVEIRDVRAEEWTDDIDVEGKLREG